ncbi:MAG: 3'-5' exoribonuclease [Burkholderiales bacterium]|jgi:exodeoxyribonuclease VIII|nr:3'-5' exoribonuclease [Burkholderiales bacterium]
MNTNDTHYVLDIETLGLCDNAIIASVGIVRMENGVQAGCFYITIDTEQPNRSYDEETMEWWGDDERSVARAEFDGNIRLFPFSLKNALLGVAQFLNTDDENETAPIWGNGSDFDNRILDHAFRQHGMQWPYWRNACLRTLRNLVGGERYTPTTERVKHIAINDAMTEAEELIYLLNRIKIESQT